MKTAKEMFEELGYFKIENKETLKWLFKTSDDCKTICFSKKSKYIRLYYVIKEDVVLFCDELQAINKQVEELGWLDE